MTWIWHTYIFKSSPRPQLLSLKKLHFLICSMRLAFLGFYSFPILSFINKGLHSFFIFFGQVFIRLSFFHFTASFLMSLNHILDPPHIPHQKVPYLLPQEPLLFSSFKNNNNNKLMSCNRARSQLYWFLAGLSVHLCL